MMTGVAREKEHHQGGDSWRSAKETEEQNENEDEEEDESDNHQTDIRGRC